MPTQKKTLEILKQILKSSGCQHRVIKIHGGQYQEAGLPDVMVFLFWFSRTQAVITYDEIPDNFDDMIARQYRNTVVKDFHLWLEIKRSWHDVPTDLQRWNVEVSLPNFGWITGYLVGDEYRPTWDTSIPVKSFATVLDDLKRQMG